MNSTITLFWFRRDLRLEDNVGLYHALAEGDKVLPIFIFDKQILEELTAAADRRVDFIYQALEYLQKQLLELGSTLIVMHAKPLDAFKKLTEKYTIDAVFTNRDYEPYALKRDTEIEGFLGSKGIAFKTFKDQVVFEPTEILKSDNTPYTIYTPYSKVWKQRLSANPIKFADISKVKTKFLKIAPGPTPTLKSLGFIKTTTAFSVPKINASVVRLYHETRNVPAIEGTTKLSVHLRFGTISIRTLVTEALKLNEQWLNELIWREFFMSILFHFPFVVHQSFKKKYDNIVWRNNEKEFEKWCTGKTGYPIVDAGMRELNATGFMHNRVRMVVASFLTKHLLIDWRWGEAYFAKKLIDFDLSANNGNWQWAAGCGCDAAPYFRVFNPTEQTKRFDSELIYTKKWVPELETLEYPAPMVEHSFARERALKTFKDGLLEQ